MMILLRSILLKL